MKQINIVKREGPERTSAVVGLSSMTHEEQIQTANRLFLGEDCTACKSLLRELEKKRYGYYQQDLRKKRVTTIDEVLTIDEVTEKIVASKLRCIYCSCHIYLFYKESRDPHQWTLDRVDNTRAHTYNNTCVSCLGCNLERRRTSHAGYVFTKNLSIRKLE